jgi:hypothetical protein
MNLETLIQHVKSGSIKEINLVSMEGGSLVIHALMGPVSHPVIDARGKTLHVASVDEARKLLSGLKGVDLYLVQPAVHDEMVGLESGSIKPDRQQIPLRSSF